MHLVVLYYCKNVYFCKFVGTNTIEYILDLFIFTFLQYFIAVIYTL